MALEGTGAGATDFVGAQQNPADGTIQLRGPLSSSWPTSGLVEINVSDTELERGTISGTTITMISGGRAIRPYGTFSTAQTHAAGDKVTLVAAWDAMQNMFPWKADEVILSGNQATIQFPNLIAAIPTTGSALEILYQLRDTTAGTTSDPLRVRFNGDSSAAYGSGELYNSNSTTASYFEEVTQTSARCGIVVAGGTPANYFGQGRIFIPNYANNVGTGTLVKQGVGNAFSTYSNAGGATTSRQINFFWASTVGITTITLLLASGSFAATGWAKLIIWP